MNKKQVRRPTQTPAPRGRPPLGPPARPTLRPSGAADAEPALADPLPLGRPEPGPRPTLVRSSRLVDPNPPNLTLRCAPSPKETVVSCLRVAVTVWAAAARRRGAHNRCTPGPAPALLAWSAQRGDSAGASCASSAAGPPS
eukprot:6023093-Prymnesium_polylepis.1